MARFELHIAAAVVLAVMAGIATAGENKAGVMAQQSCQGDMRGLWNQCMPYVQKGAPREQPSQGCCDMIKNTDLSCACKHLSHHVEQQLDMDNAVYVAGYCGNPLSHGMQCGGYTVP
ncbi:hypothetical protein EUGRSUZ_G03260 [Eucalyptus grandis]|uniref:Bifunctional inhibitor/plant lipid transfer protein/seed storage helical domain-containing protein n=2 Tax=Eucalyptus grandis TaxID=71139 RepID=A0A059BID9_EUCGR|nr:hypothetical protein EUGRSUZ_G03260 [Eucalyptus grandis]